MYAKQNNTSDDDDDAIANTTTNIKTSGSNSSNSNISALMGKLILGHNLALNYLITNKPDEGVSILLPLFRSFHAINGTTNVDSNDVSGDNKKMENAITADNSKFGDGKCKIAFLLLDCVLAAGTSMNTSTNTRMQLMNEILQWIENYIISFALPQTNESNSSSLKFRLHYYKSRGLFLQSKLLSFFDCDTDGGNGGTGNNNNCRRSTGSKKL
jgi:hypothetical protein